MRRVRSYPPPSRRPVRRAVLPVDPRDPAAPPEEPEPLLPESERPVERECDECGRTFRPAPADGDAQTCTWCLFEGATW